MNRRIYKKLCKRAMATLIEKHGYDARSFSAVKRGEEFTWDAPENMDARSRSWGPRSSSNFFAPLKGTPIRWERVSYEYNDWEPKSPVELLDHIEFCEAIEARPDIWLSEETTYPANIVAPGDVA